MARVGENGAPRLLLGAALLFWGGMTGRAVPGLACALLLEAAHWTRIRWNFGERGQLAAWRLSVLLLLVTMVLVLLQGARLNAMARVFTWLPVVLMPLQFVQSFGMSRSMSLAVFSVMVRRRRDHAARHGLPFREIRFGFGSVYFCATLLASTLGEMTESPIFYPGLVALTAWGLVASSGRGWRRASLAALVSVVSAAAIGLAGQAGLTKLYHYILSRGGPGGDYGLEYRREHQTSIGKLGRIKQSPAILWRLIPEQGGLPPLLKIASYNTYQTLGARWQADRLPEALGQEPKDEGFDSLAEINNPYNPSDLEDKFLVAPPDLVRQQDAVDQSLPRFRLRGAVNTSGRMNLMPVPADVASFHEFAPEEFGRNPFGTFRFEPTQPVIDARILHHPRFSPELPPWTSLASRRFDLPPDPAKPGAPVREFRQVRVQPDLEIPRTEAEMIARVADRLKLRDGGFADKVTTLRLHFYEHFAYSKYNKVRDDFDPKRHGTLIGKFLEHTRSGHCEYFATATALLLREAGIPTRYVSGFAVVETDPDTQQAIIRGIHGHAWCRAWNAEERRWVDVDLTPPQWTGIEIPRMSRFQSLTDGFQQLREDLLVWRDKPGRMKWLTLGLLTPLVAGLVFIGRNLWRSRARVEEADARRRGGVAVATPLTALEKAARRRLGERPPGTPLAPWLKRLAPALPKPELLDEAVKLHHRLRFDPVASDPAALERLKALVQELRAGLGRGG
jgi:hypothetical protein